MLAEVQFVVQKGERLQGHRRGKYESVRFEGTQRSEMKLAGQRERERESKGTRYYGS